MESFEEGCAEAEARGDTVLVADARELFIDLDSDEQRKQFDQMFERVRLEYDCAVAERWPSKTPGHEHVIVRMKSRDFTVAERIALQSILGSDPLRDLLTLARLHSGIEQPIRLFKPRVCMAQQPAYAGLLSSGTSSADDDDDLPF